MSPDLIVFRSHHKFSATLITRTFDVTLKATKLRNMVHDKEFF